jgi:ATP-binding cassette subfamily F protein 3
MEFPEAQSLLGRFLLSGEQVFQPVATLSGGEKNKLSLAKITAMKPNTLILDEPTNHLDMDSREALAQVLQEFDGTLVLVSHDRHLLENVTDHTLDVRPDGLRQFPGSYNEYRASLKAPSPKTEITKTVERTTLSPREISKEINRLDREVERAEAHVSTLETNLAAQEKKLESLGPDADFTKETSLHADLSAELGQAISHWETVTQQLENLRRLQGA